MGSTLETAIVFTAVITVLTAMLMMPADLVCESVDDVRFGFEELRFHSENSDVLSSDDVGGVSCNDISEERICTLLSGLSDNYRLIYGGVTDADE